MESCHASPRVPAHGSHVVPRRSADSITRGALEDTMSSTREPLSRWPLPAADAVRLEDSRRQRLHIEHHLGRVLKYSASWLSRSFRRLSVLQTSMLARRQVLAKASAVYHVTCLAPCWSSTMAIWAISDPNPRHSQLFAHRPAKADAVIRERLLFDCECSFLL